jgi:RNA polymerase sigma factor (sigma-70 family)
MTDHPHAEELAAEVAGVRRIVRGLVRDGGLAEDVAQEAWLTALSTRPPDDVPLRWWLAGIARNLARRLRRGESRRDRRERAVARPEGATPPDLVARAETHRRVMDAVLALEEPYRGTLLLRFFDDLPSAEIARRLGVPAATVRSRLRRGLDLLRSRLDETHGTRRTWTLALLPLTAWTRPSAAAEVIAVKTSTKAAIAVVLCLALAGGGAWIAARAPREVHPESDVVATSSTPAPTASPSAAPAALRGVVRRASTTRPIAGARVALRCEGRELVVTTDGQGAFRFADVPADAPAHIVARAEGTRASQPLEVRVRSGEDRDVGTLWLERGVEFDVFVRSRTDEPVADARVEIQDGLGLSFPDLDPVDPTPPTLAAEATDADGHASFADLPARDVRVVASKPGFATATALRRPAHEDASLPIVLRLGEGHALAGHVLDADGHPVPRALVSIDGPVRYAARADATGAYALSGLARGDFDVACARPGATPTPGRAARVRIPDVAQLDLVLPEPARIEGLVTEAESGAPVAGAIVRARTAWASAGTVSGADGRYAIDGLAECVVELLDATKGDLVLDPGPEDDPVARRFAVRGGATTVRDLKLRRGARIEGVVLGDDVPVPGALVRAVVRRGHSVIRALAGDDGRFTLALPAGRARIWAEREQWSVDLGGRGWEAAEVEIPVSGVVPLELRLIRNTAVVEGRVVDPAGAGIAGAHCGYGASCVASGEDGSFRCEGLVQARDAWFACSKEGFVESRVTLDLSSGRQAGLVVHLERGPRIVGSVRTADGNAPRDAEVAITVVTDERRAQPGGSTAPYVVQVDHVPVRADGSFEATLPWAGSGTLRVAASAAGGLSGLTADAPVQRGVPEHHVDVVLASTAAIEGRVVDESTGDGVAGARVIDGDGAIVATTDAAGGFVAVDCRPTPDGTCPLSAAAAEYMVGTWARVPADGRRNVRLTLARGFEIAGVVRFDDGSPAAGVAVAADRPYQFAGGAPDARLTGVDGRFQLRGVARGAHALHVTAPPRMDVDVVPLVSDPVECGSADVVLVVRRGATISGVVRDADGRPLSGIAISATQRGGRGDSVVARSGADGAFRLRGLPDGVFDLAAERDPYPGTEPLLPARRFGVPGGTSGVEFVLGATLSLQGIVVDEDGRPVSGLALVAGASQAVTREDGSFVLSGLASGRHAIRLGQGNTGTLEPSDEVPAGTRGLRLTLRRAR